MLRKEIKAIATSHQDLCKQSQGGVPSTRGKLLDALSEIDTIIAMSLITISEKQGVINMRQN